MDSDKLQKLANIAIVRQHAASVTSSTNFPRKYINQVANALGTLDTEFINLLIETKNTSDNIDEKDVLTISQRLAEEKAKLKAKTEVTIKNVTMDLDNSIEVIQKSASRPAIKTTRSSKKNETPVDKE